MTEVEARWPRTKGELLRLGRLQWLWWGMDEDRSKGRRPRTKSELLRLGGLQWLWWGMDDDRGRGAAAKDQWPTPAARWPAVCGWGDGQ